MISEPGHGISSGGGQTTPSAASSTGMQMLAYAGAGVVAVIAAQYAPKVVNSILILILVGFLLNHASSFTGLINKFPGVKPA